MQRLSEREAPLLHDHYLHLRLPLNLTGAPAVTPSSPRDRRQAGRAEPGVEVAELAVDEGLPVGEGALQPLAVELEDLALGAGGGAVDGFEVGRQRGEDAGDGGEAVLASAPSLEAGEAIGGVLGGLAGPRGGLGVGEERLEAAGDLLLPLLGRVTRASVLETAAYISCCVASSGKGVVTRGSMATVSGWVVAWPSTVRRTGTSPAG